MQCVCLSVVRCPLSVVCLFTCLSCRCSSAHRVPGAALGYRGGWPSVVWSPVPQDSPARLRAGRWHRRHSRLPPLGCTRDRQTSTSKEPANREFNIIGLAESLHRQLATKARTQSGLKRAVHQKRHTERPYRRSLTSIVLTVRTQYVRSMQLMPTLLSRNRREASWNSTPQTLTSRTSEVSPSLGQSAA